MPRKPKGGKTAPTKKANKKQTSTLFFGLQRETDAIGAPSLQFHIPASSAPFPPDHGDDTWIQPTPPSPPLPPAILCSYLLLTPPQIANNGSLTSRVPKKPTLDFLPFGLKLTLPAKLLCLLSGQYLYLFRFF